MRRDYVEYMGKRYPMNDAPINILAFEVIEGKFGSGEKRKMLLGSKYVDVQTRVNELVYSTRHQKPVIKDDWDLQNRVNELVYSTRHQKPVIKDDWMDF